MLRPIPQHHETPLPRGDRHQRRRTPPNRRVEAFTAEGSTVAPVVREIGVPEVTPPTSGGWDYRWRRKYAGMGKPEAKRLRDELLSQEAFATLAEAEVLAERWRRHYNESRPHSVFGYLPPAAYAASLPPPSNRRRHCHSHWYEGRGPVRSRVPDFIGKKDALPPVTRLSTINVLGSYECIPDAGRIRAFARDIMKSGPGFDIAHAALAAADALERETRPLWRPVGQSVRPFPQPNNSVGDQVRWYAEPFTPG